MHRPTSPRVPLVENPEGDLAELLAQAPAHEGTPLNLFRVLAHHPELLQGFLDLGGQLMENGVVEARTRELLILRVGWRCQSSYELSQHARAGKQAGLTDAEIAGAAGGSSAWLPADALLLQLVDELCDDDCVGDRTFSELCDHMGKKAVLELITCVGFYRMLAGILNSFGVPLDEGIATYPES